MKHVSIQVKNNDTKITVLGHVTPYSLVQNKYGFLTTVNDIHIWVPFSWILRMLWI